MQTTSSATSPERSSALSVTALVAWSGIAAVLVVLAFAGRAAGDTDREVFYRWETAFGSLVVYGLLILMTIWIATSFHGSAFVALGLRPTGWRWVWIAVGLVLAVLVVGLALEPVLHAGEEQGYRPERWQPSRAEAFLVNGIVAATLVPFAEELFFRGLGVRALAFLGGLVPVGLTAVAFGLGHGVLAALPILVLFGVALGWVRLRSASVWPAVAAHSVYNGIAVLGTYVYLTN